MELRALLVDGGHQWDGNPPASEQDIADLVAVSPVPGARTPGFDMDNHSRQPPRLGDVCR